jgi:hypothetical protein
MKSGIQNVIVKLDEKNAIYNPLLVPLHLLGHKSLSESVKSL